MRSQCEIPSRPSTMIELEPSLVMAYHREASSKICSLLSVPRASSPSANFAMRACAHCVPQMVSPSTTLVAAVLLGRRQAIAIIHGVTRDGMHWART